MIKALQKKRHGFCPTEIIFAPTTACNLHCAHCFVSRNSHSLDVNAAKRLLISCKGTSIEKIGFSGGEPFLALDFITAISKIAVENDFLFDQIITNGDWWKTVDDLNAALTALYDSGYDGKISVSFDTFHNQKPERTADFIKTAAGIFGAQSVTIQSVINAGVKDDFYARLLKLSELLGTKISDYTNRKSSLGLITLENDSLFIQVYVQPQSFSASDECAWKAKRWFKEDFCEDPGNVLFVHADGNIAPCCGFANESLALSIGSINDEFKTIMKNAQNNALVRLCYEQGLSSQIKNLKNQKKLPFPHAKCGEECTFCEFVCTSLTN